MKDAYYFSHDCNARSDIKIVDMMYDYGIEGYGVFWIIVEILREQEGYSLPVGRNTTRLVSKETMKETAFIEKFIDDCINKYNLFAQHEDSFYSKSLLFRMQKVEDVKEKRRQAVQKRWNSTTNEIQMDNKSNTNELQNDTKEKKRKEKKEKEINNIEQQVARVWSLYPNKKGKAQAIKKIPKLIEEYGEEKMIECIEAYSNECKGNDIKYIQHGSTFFNGGYIDYLETAPQEEPKYYYEENPLTGEQIRKRV